MPRVLMKKQGVSTLTPVKVREEQESAAGHCYSVSDGTYTYSITASVLTYARSCVIKKKATEAEKNIGKALYLYNKAAVAAFGG